MILIDSNVLIDILDQDPNWYNWSLAEIENAATGRIFINHIVLAECAPHVGDLDEFRASLDAMAISIEPLTDKGAYLSGIAFLAYRKRREGARTVLPDFLIGGHALSLGATILTRDPRFYRTYFPTVPLIAPEKDEND